MNPSNFRPVPPLWRRLFAVGYRHASVYNRNFFTNSFGVVLEPLMFFAAMGLGLSAAMGSVGGVDYLAFLVPGQVMIGVFFSAAFETSYGTYFRLVMDHNYDAMVVTPLSVDDVFWGELLYVGARGAFFGGIILAVFACLGLVHSWWAVLIPFVAFFAAVTLGSLGFFANRLVRNLNQFNYFISGIVSPLTLFSGTIFPLERLPKFAALLAYWMPFYPSVHLARMLATGHFDPDLWGALAYVVIAPWPLGYFAVKCIKPKLIK